MIAKLRFRFWLAIATALILLIGDRKQQENYNSWLEERLRMLALERSEAIQLEEQRRLVGEEMPDVLEEWDEVRRLRVFGEFLERLP